MPNVAKKLDANTHFGTNVTDSNGDKNWHKRVIMKKQQIVKKKKEFILHEFFTISVDDDLTGESFKITYEQLPQYKLDNFYIEVEDNVVIRNCEIQISEIFDILQEVMKLKNEYESISLIWDEDGSYKSFYRIVGVKMESDEEFELRKNDIEKEIKKKESEKLLKKQAGLDRKKEKLAKLRLELFDETGYVVGMVLENIHTDRLATIKRVDPTGCVISNGTERFFCDFDEIKQHWKLK